MAGYLSDTYMGVPGIGAAVETAENEFTWGREEWKDRRGVQVSGAARDAGNSGATSALRRGLILGQLTASPGLFVQYDPAATDGSQVAVCVLSTDLNATDLAGTNTNRFAWALFGGPVKAAALIGLDYVARQQMRFRFKFDDDVNDRYACHPSLVEVAKTANYTVLATDAGTLFTNAGASGAVTFTLPAIAKGLGPFEFLVVADQTVTITSPGAIDNIVAFNDAAADSIAFSTGGAKVGGRVRVEANQAGTLWYVTNLSQGNTITVAT